MIDHLLFYTEFCLNQNSDKKRLLENILPLMRIFKSLKIMNQIFSEKKKRKQIFSKELEIKNNKKTFFQGL